jgi:hypothetical protein
MALDPLARLWRSGPRDARDRVADYTVDLDVTPYEGSAWIAGAGLPVDRADSGGSGGYDKLRWLGAEIRGRSGLGTRERGPFVSSSFFGSPLHRWNEAARAHREAAQSILAREGYL